MEGLPPGLLRKTEELFSRWLSLPDVSRRLQHECSLLQQGLWDRAEADKRWAGASAPPAPSPSGAFASPSSAPAAGGLAGTAHHAASPAVDAAPSLVLPSPPPTGTARSAARRAITSLAAAPAPDADPAAASPLSTALLQVAETRSAAAAATVPPSPPFKATAASVASPLLKRPSPAAVAAAALPPFFVPFAPPPADEVARVCGALTALAGGAATVPLAQCADAAALMGLPRACAFAVARRAHGDALQAGCPLPALLALWGRLAQQPADAAARLVALLAPDRPRGAEPADFAVLAEHVVKTHPGLAFLADRPEFQERYVQTVVHRLFFEANRSWSGALSAAELRRSPFLATLAALDGAADINLGRTLFSYEHFYVMYTTFWKLDGDHDLLVTRAELARYGDGALSDAILDRVFAAGTVLHPAWGPGAAGRMAYADFVWFMLAEEDKAHPTSIEYWFRCMDLDGDGVLSLHELRHFYDEQAQRMADIGAEVLVFEDAVCIALDMVHPRRPHAIALADLRRCGNAKAFFNMFFNLNKYLESEEKDAFAAHRERMAEGDEPWTDWGRFAAVAYEILSTEEDEDVADDGDPGDGSAFSDGDLYDGF